MNTSQKALEKWTKRKTNPMKVTGWALAGTGAVALVVSTIYSSSILAFIGLGLLFWGLILSYIQTEEYVKSNLLEATALSSLESLDQIMTELHYTGKAVYLPPKYLRDPEENKAYIPKQEIAKLPTPEQTQEQENQVFSERLQAMILTPPGAELTKLFEKTLGTTFTKEDMAFLQQNMPKLLVEDLEMAQSFEMTSESNQIHVKIESPAYASLTKQTENLSRLHTGIGCPLSSAIACALAKATGKPIIIENQETSENGKSISINYRVLVEEKKEQ